MAISQCFAFFLIFDVSEASFTPDAFATADTLRSDIRLNLNGPTNMERNTGRVRMNLYAAADLQQGLSFFFWVEGLYTRRRIQSYSACRYACGAFFFVSSFLHSTYIDHGNKVQNALFPATTDPPQVTVKLWLPQPRSHQ